MTPILTGRWQTRLLLMVIVGSLVTVLFGVLYPYFVTVFIILGLALVVGLALDVAWNAVQSRRWDHDWPPLYHFISGVVEGVILWLVVMLLFPDLPFWKFLLHYAAVWIAIFAVMWGPMKVFFLKWRYEGGRWL
jgi:hypothetical protein